MRWQKESMEVLSSVVGNEREIYRSSMAFTFLFHGTQLLM